jgi:hypothetical protein
MMHPDHLVELIRRHGARSRENLQVADRLRSLLPQVLRSLKRGYQSRGGDAERHALNDAVYLERIQEYLDVYAEGLESKIQSETHRMMLQAMHSLNAFRRAAELRQQKLAELGKPARPSVS